VHFPIGRIRELTRGGAAVGAVPLADGAKSECDLRQFSPVFSRTKALDTHAQTFLLKSRSASDFALGNCARAAQSRF
jgi:hypothetical protein